MCTWCVPGVKGVYRRWVWYRVGILGGYTGWVPGVLYRPSQLLEEGSPTRRPATAGSGPLQRRGGSEAGWGWTDVLVRARPWTTHSRPCRPSGTRSAVQALPTGKGRHFRSFPVKLVKTAKCHRKVSKRPVLVPISQNGSKKSPLEFLGFPF